MRIKMLIVSLAALIMLVASQAVPTRADVIEGIDIDSASGMPRYFSTNSSGYFLSLSTPVELEAAEYVNCSVAATSNSGTGCNPTGGDASGFCLNNQSTGSIFLNTSATAALNVGFRLLQEGTFCAAAPATVTRLSVYNPHGGAATISVIFWRLP